MASLVRIGAASVSQNVRHDGMRIVVHILVCYVILGLSSMRSVVHLGVARSLSLTGPITSAIVELCHLALIFLYALIVIATRKSAKPWVWIGGALGVMILAFIGNWYPQWVVAQRSQKIEIGSFTRGDDMFLPDTEIKRFEKTFGTRTAQYSQSGGGPWLVVRREKYSPSMIAFLKEEAQKRAELQHGADPSQPLRSP